MISAREIRKYGDISISKWIYYDCPPDCTNSGKNRISFEVWNNNTYEFLESFNTYKAAKKFAQRYISGEIFSKI